MRRVTAKIFVVTSGTVRAAVRQNGLLRTPVIVRLSMSIIIPMQWKWIRECGEVAIETAALPDFEKR